MSIPGITHTTGKIEWYTPAWLWRAAAEVMGGIDLDPCSNSRDEPAVPAATIYTKEDDGLVNPWHGRIYLNPPWGRGIERWVNKCLAEYHSGRVTAAVLAVPASTETLWFRPLWAHTICFAQGRCYFIDGETGVVPDKGGPTPVAYAYLGVSPERFARTFSQFGAVVQGAER